MASPPQKEALALILDVNPNMGARFPIAKEVASSLIQQKLVFSPRDEIGIIFAGTAGTLNRLSAAAPGAYQHVTIVRPIIAPDADFLTPLEAATLSDGHQADMFDALIVAADLIHERTENKRYNRRIVFVTNADSVVKKKEQLQVIIDGLKNKSISLVVIGIDFDEVDEDAAADEDWSSFTPKQKNERVLRYICKEVSENSVVIPVSDAAMALSALRKRNIPQRSFSRCLLNIGEIKIPVYLYVKALAQAFPSMHRTTAKGDFVTETRYFSVRKPDVEIEADQRIKAYRYGKSVIPFNEVDVEAMKFKASRSMMALGFIPISSVPVHLLMGGVKAVAPVPGDANSAAALSAFVHGMEILKRAMLVRFTWRENSDPSLGVCFPSAKASRNILYYVPLPFAEDLRHYSFDTLSHVKLTKAEDDAIDAVVNAMTVDSDTLAPKTVFNPALQQYYASVRARYLDPAAPMPPLPPELKRTACAWGEEGNVLQATLTSAKEAISKLTLLFPPAPEKTEVTGKAAKVFWFAKAGAEKTKPDTSIEDGAPAAKRPRTDNYFGSNSTTTTQTGESSNQSSISALREAVAVSQAAVTHVTTVDPVGTFHALLAVKGVDNVARAVFEMTEVIFRLLKESIGEQYYPRAFESIVALRAACIREGEPSSFNRFFVNLMMTVRGEAHNAFWVSKILEKKIRPISRKESDESDLTEEEAERMATDYKTPTAPVIDEEPEEDLFDQLE
jgi:ATP-dependent DNA helicase 2 subunit 2